VFDRMVGGQEFDPRSCRRPNHRPAAGGDRCAAGVVARVPARLHLHQHRRRHPHAKGLEGKRVGLPLYTQTAAIWARGHLAHQFGALSTCHHWVQGVEEAGTHGEPHAPPLPRPVAIEQNQGRRSPRCWPRRDRCADRLAQAGPWRDPASALLIGYAHASAALRGRQIFPIMHLIAMRRELYERHRWLASSLYKALLEAKRRALARLRYAGSLAVMLPWLQSELEEIDTVFGGDAWPYGIAANQATLQALVAYMHEQHFIAQPTPIENLFVPIPDGLGT
jgi:4,5-dihydroxyphthalate decarboxylase